MSAYPLENLLRKPVEWYSSALCFLVAVLCLLLSFHSSIVVSMVLPVIGFTLLGVCRFIQGYRVFYYCRHLKRLPDYVVSSDALPIQPEKLFLGKGFRWEVKHTQRLYDLKQAGQAHYLRPTHFQRNALSTLGGNSAIHGVETKEETVFMPLSERVGHTMILGTTRVGKTRLLELMISSDIRRNESALIVFDPKGDLDLLKRIAYEAKQSHRENDVIIFHLGYPECSARYNPIGHFSRITEVANRVANQLPSSGESAAFKEFAWRFVNIITTALVALGRRPNYHDLDQYILNIDPLLLEYCSHWLPTIDSCWKETVEQEIKQVNEQKLAPHLRSRDPFMLALVRYVDRLNVDNSIYGGLKAIFDYDQTYFQKITASLSPLFSKLTSGKIAALISPDYLDIHDQRPIFDWMQVIRGKKIVYVGLDALSDSTVSSAVGNSMFADLCSTTGQIYKFGVQVNKAQTNFMKSLHEVNVYGDEFNELAGEEFIPLANKGGGAGLQLTVATQTASDVIARLGNVAKANQVFGNFNSLICLRVLEEGTARLLIDKLAQRVKVQFLLSSSATNDSAHLTDEVHFTSHNEDRLITSEVPLISSEDLMQLPKGQAFCLLNGGQLWKVRFPLPKNDMTGLPDHVEGIIAYLQASV